MKAKLFLDDKRNPYDVFKQTVNPIYEYNESWIIVRSFMEFKTYLVNNEIPDLMSLDHDLDQSHYLPINQKNINYRDMKIKSGYHCLKWFISYSRTNMLRIPDILIHSQNEAGRMNMEKLLKSI